MDVYDFPDAVTCDQAIFSSPPKKKKKKTAWSNVTDAVSTETQMKQTCLRQNMIMN